MKNLLIFTLFLISGGKTPPVKPTTTKIPTAETSRRSSTPTPAPTTSQEPRSGEF
ncbi:hypothetical protein AMEX_G24685 [Astyanax mexicanus]|uniref:Uncharacterized protein n=1 Tax=Astyanax mexicanus TaxID=7994 RepID=A0A8T2KYN9_ASTMX|nr:hypothetical protein AMEX_G24685 [Astyanax mexicanus]